MYVLVCVWLRLRDAKGSFQAFVVWRCEYSPNITAMIQESVPLKERQTHGVYVCICDQDCSIWNRKWFAKQHVTPAKFSRTPSLSSTGPIMKTGLSYYLPLCHKFHDSSVHMYHHTIPYHDTLLLIDILMILIFYWFLIVFHIHLLLCVIFVYLSEKCPYRFHWSNDGSWYLVLQSVCA